MPINEVTNARRQARNIVLGQLGISLLAAAFYAVLNGQQAAVSALLGGGIGVMATALMAYAVLKYPVGTPAVSIAVGLFVGWLVKVGLSIGLLVVALRSPRVESLPLLTTYIATFAVFWTLRSVHHGAVAHRQP